MDHHSEKDAAIVGSPPTAPAKSEEVQAPESASATTPAEDTKSRDRTETTKKSPKNKCSKKHAKAKKSKKSKKEVLTDSSSSESSEAEAEDVASSSDSSSSDSESEPEEKKKKKASKKRLDTQKSKKKLKAKKVKKPVKVQVTPTSGSESLSDSSDSDDADDMVDGDQQRSQQDLMRQMQLMQLGHQYPYQGNAGLPNSIPPIYEPPGIYNRLPPIGAPIGGRPRRAGHPQARRLGLGIDPNLPIIRDGKQLHNGKLKRKTPRLDFKRVDQVWDNSIHNYKLQDTAEATAENLYEDYLFHVRRNFDWEGKYKATYIDIKSKLLRECLQDVMGNIKGVSLVEDTPKLDPNMLFLYLEEFRDYLKELKKAKPSGADKHERKKQQKRIDGKRQHLKILVKYIDKDYDQVKSSLYPMLQNGLITFDLLWALWKPNTLAYTTTYGSHDEPRVFKVEMAEKHHTIIKGDFYYIEGKYFEFDGKQFGYGSMSEEMGDFRGARKITSLNCYPLMYHKNSTQLRKDLIERGKKFVALSGVHYKSHQGMAYYKKKKSVIKVNINGRIMVDPNVHRRINPNYPISLVRPKDHDVLSDDDESDGESACCCGLDSDTGGNEASLGDEEKTKYVTKLYKDDKGRVQLVRMTKEEADELKEKLDEVQSKDGDSADTAEDTPTEETSEKKPPEFSDEEYLIASPVVLGFAFAEKMWLEFTVSGVKEIQWNETAYDSLVLERKTKDIVKALVESHKYHAAESIDDVIQGKGRGLVAVLHGPPGTGKTLTAEGISELLKCPLYMVSAGELGTDSRFLEQELQKILDICHAWGAILLLDEADVFLEKRNMHDIHRNALVSIFLRQLEYFQGILFLTTNRVETFDDAFQSRIHIALRYDNLDRKAKKTIFKIFIERVRVLEKIDLMPFTEDDYDQLARHELNGRQIKNTVRAAQALAVNKGEPLAMSHIRQVLEVQMRFDRDLKGGTGYEDAMRGYF